MKPNAEKPHAEMNEGPEALKRFEDTMRAIFSKRKAVVSHAARAKTKADTTTRETKPNQTSK